MVIRSRTGWDKVLEIDFFNVKRKENQIIKVKVKMDASKIIKSSLKIMRPDRKPMQVNFKYEKMGNFGT